jgi:KUP system potassium uptake protein
MSTNSEPRASSADADDDSSAAAPADPPNPTQPAGAPGRATSEVNASNAPPGSEFRASTGMFPVGGGLRPNTTDEEATGKRLAVLTLTALGVVYGDIGTSPLYSLKECFGPHYNLAATRENVFGILSMVVWALTLVVSVKYISFVLRADNRGEGGQFALLSLIFPARGSGLDRNRGKWVVALALFGTALLYGDGIITPAMSVLGAMEGLGVAAPSLERFIVPIAVVILMSLFAVQSYGTDKMGKAFGPVMLVWFLSIGILGAMEIARSPWILAAVNPMYAFTFASHHGGLAFLVLGSVVLVITGG